MMKLEFGDVLEYVRAGEDDPNMQSVLRQHPDGPEMLEQARLMFGMMRLRSSKRPESRSDRSLVSLDAPVELRSPKLSEPREFHRLSEPTVAREEAPREPLGFPWDTRRSRGELGTLVVMQRGERIRISFEPGQATKARSGYDEDHGVAGTDGLAIQAARFIITLADNMSANEALAICLTDLTRRKPVEGIELIFMPDTGPFVKLLTNRNGVVDLAPPVQPGMLRIGSRPSQLLRIKLA